MKSNIKFFIGIDWSRETHQVSVLNEAGQAVVRFMIRHNHAGFEQLQKQLNQIHSNPTDMLVAIETDHNQVVDFLYGLGYIMYLIPPNVVKGNRSRQSNAGAKDDVRDADLLSTIVRTDHHHLTPWHPAGELVQSVRHQVRLIDDLTEDIVRGHNRLEAQLLRYFPVGADIFSSLTTQIALKFLIQYPTPTLVAQVSPQEFEAFCKANRYPQLARIAQRYARLKQVNPARNQSLETIYGHTMPVIAQQLLADVQQKNQLLKKMNTLFLTHPDAEVYRSIPGCGNLLSPKLLTIFGDNRERFSSPDHLRALAGTAPVTSQSGKSRSVYFRKACNKEWRETFQQVAMVSVKQSVWAATYYEEARFRGKKKSQAYRSLANRWVGIIWTLWQRKQPYDEALHLSHVARFKRS